MDTQIVTLPIELTQPAAPAGAWRTAARLALEVLLGAALTAAPVIIWAAWLRGR
jgi:hypothetical protein